MRGTLIFAGSSCPALTGKICGNLGMEPANAELTQFANGETSVRILTSVREKDVFIVQSGSPKINDTVMELLIMISACKGGSANKTTAVLPYFPYSRQSKKKSHRGAITARMLANLLDVAGVKHVVTVDLHASQMQGFFRCPVDNLHAEPLIARWIRHNVPDWKEAVVVSKNAGGTKRVTSLADALKLSFGIVTTDRRRPHNNNKASSVNAESPLQKPIPDMATDFDSGAQQVRDSSSQECATHTVGDAQGLPRARPPKDAPGALPATEENDGPRSDPDDEPQYNDSRAEVTQGRLFHGRIVPDDFPSPSVSATDGSCEGIDGAVLDPMSQSHSSSFFVGSNGLGGLPSSQQPQPQPQQQHALGGDVVEVASSDEEEEIFTKNPKNPQIEHMITLVGDVRDRTVLIVDDMIDKPGSWIAAAETVVKRGHARRVYCIATHAVFGADCLEQMQACDFIEAIVVTNSYPIREEAARAATKLIILDLSFLLAEAIRRNHYGESISPLFQHMGPD